MRRSRLLALLTLGVFALTFSACGGGSITGTGDVQGEGVEVDDEWDDDDADDDEWDEDDSGGETFIDVIGDFPVLPDADVTEIDEDAEQDVLDVADVDEDAEPACEPGYAEWLCPCETDDDCYAGHCVDGAEGKIG